MCSECRQVTCGSFIPKINSHFGLFFGHLTWAPSSCQVSHASFAGANWSRPLLEFVGHLRMKAPQHRSPQSVGSFFQNHGFTGNIDIWRSFLLATKKTSSSSWEGFPVCNILHVSFNVGPACFLFRGASSQLGANRSQDPTGHSIHWKYVPWQRQLTAEFMAFRPSASGLGEGLWEA